MRKSATLLKNNSQVLPLSKTQKVTVMGRAADSIGHQCGGWTISWMGGAGDITPGTSILAGIQQAIGAENVDFQIDGGGGACETAIVVLAEEPYAEGMGDREDLCLSAEQKALLGLARAKAQTLVLILLSGRPLIISEELPDIDAFIAAWLPGTEGAGLADVLFGDYPFQGQLRYSWPVSMADIPVSSHSKSLFPLVALEKEFIV